MGTTGVAMRQARALGYIRVSTTDQAERGYGLDIQRQAILDYCNQHDLHLLDILGDEGQSGSSGLTIRPGLAEALTRIERQEGSLLVLYRLDRLARDLLLQETVVERLRLRGGSVVSVTEPDVDSNEPTRVLIRQILGALSQYEKTLLKTRMAAGRRLKAARGGYTGGIPRFGYDVEHRNYVPNASEQETVAEIVRLRETGVVLQAIADALNAEDLPAKLGGTWHRGQVRRVLDQNEPTQVRLPTGATRHRGGIARFGYTVERHECVPVASEQEVIERIKAMRASGTLLQAIADALNEVGLTAKRGGGWNRKAVFRVLRQTALPLSRQPQGVLSHEQGSQPQ